jgi:D-ribose pyranase
MLKSGILNPHLAALLSRFRHTNTLVISDRGFPYWPTVPTVDISLVDDIPTVRQVLRAVTEACTIGNAWMAKEFHTLNSTEAYNEYASLLGNVPIEFESHVDFKKRVPLAMGLIRTGDTTQYGNIILQSA